MALVLAPSALAASPVDTVTATGSSTSIYSNIDISAQSGTSGQNPTGSGSFTLYGAILTQGQCPV